MKNLLEFFRSIYVLIPFFILQSCNAERNHGLPVLETKNITYITQTSAKSGGNITSDGGSEITAQGICWGTNTKPTLSDSHTSDGSGNVVFDCALTGLIPDTEYHVRAYATNAAGTAYGDEMTFRTLSSVSSGPIIADHTVVDKYDKIPQQYIDAVRKMWLVTAGESHSQAYRTGLSLLATLYPAYDVNVKDGGTPEAYTTSHLRASGATWGDYDNSSGWIYWYGEEDWFTNSTGILRTKAGITYCNTHNLEIAAIGLVWCNDLAAGAGSSATDPLYGCHWYGSSVKGPEGDLPWGIDAEDYSVTGNTVCLNTYLSVTQEYIDYCASNGYSTKVFFTTGPVDSESSWWGEKAYQGHLKHEYIRNYVNSDPARILFDYADILCYDNDGTPATDEWNGHTFPVITTTNVSPVETGHISNAGAIRLAKAMWWMLARIAGWDGN